MSISVKCNCGQMVFAEEAQRGQNLQCPYCKGVVAVPAGMAKSQPAAPVNPANAPKPMSPEESGLLTAAIGGCVLLVVWLFGGLLPEVVRGVLYLGGVGACVFGGKAFLKV